jgi:hypothetical protein
MELELKAWSVVECIESDVDSIWNVMVHGDEPRGGGGADKRGKRKKKWVASILHTTS